MASAALGSTQSVLEAAATPTISEGVPLTAGTQLDGRFRIVRKLGRGGMGQVYEAIDIRLGRRVAVKVLRSASGALPQLRKRFEREARAVAQVQHEHVITVFDYGIAPTDEPYLVMEYLEGQDLRGLLREQGQIAAPRAARLIHDACLGLAASHERGVIHRDLKPENLFVVSQGRRSEICKVLDFGLAKLRDSGDCDLQTRAGTPFGTLHYMSPEQARGETNVDERTDVYSLAAVLYELLSGERPHTADSPHALLHKITHEAPVRLEQRCAYLRPGLANLVHHGLATDPALRPVSIEAFGRLLAPFAGRDLESSCCDEDSVNDRETKPDNLAAPGAKVHEAGWWWRSRRIILPLVLASLVGAVGLVWLTRPAAPPSGPAKREQVELTLLERPDVPPALSADVPASPTSSVDRLEQSAAISKSTRHAARPAPPIVATVAPAPALSVSAAVSPPGTGFDRVNPYAESTSAAR